jgi:hypothetical protein
MSGHKVNGESTHDAQGKDSERIKYERALKELRRDIGCTWERLSESGQLLEALRERRGRRMDGMETIAACVEELRALIAGLSDPQQREPLLVALRMDDRYQERTLTARRRHYNEDLRKSRSDVDVRTLERRENGAIRTLAIMLAGEAPAGGRSADRALDQEDGTKSRWHFRTESREAWYKFGPNRVLREQLVAARLIALIPDANEYGTHFSYRADPNEGVLDVEPVFGCEAVGEPYFSDGISFLRLRIPRGMDVGETHDIALRVRVRSDMECQPRLMTTAGQDEKSMVKHVEFAPDALPARIWRFAHLTHPGVAHNPRQTLIPDGPHRFVRQSWSGLRIGLCYGITWDWP